MSELNQCPFLVTESHQPDVCKITGQPCDKKVGEPCETYNEEMFSYN